MAQILQNASTPRSVSLSDSRWQSHTEGASPASRPLSPLLQCRVACCHVTQPPSLDLRVLIHQRVRCILAAVASCEEPDASWAYCPTRCPTHLDATSNPVPPCDDTDLEATGTTRWMPKHLRFRTTVVLPRTSPEPFHGPNPDNTEVLPDCRPSTALRKTPPSPAHTRRRGAGSPPEGDSPASSLARRQ
jgi:hypothetical protein